MNDVLQVGVIGCGQIGRTHVSAVLQHRTETSFHLCDPNLDAAKRVVADHGLEDASCYDDPESMLNSVDLDVVHVTTPPDSHYRLAMEALDAGAHVIVEKPMALTTADAMAIFERADRAGRLVDVDHSLLLMPCVEAMIAVVRDGGLGEPIAFDCYFGHAEQGHSIPYRDPSHWAYDMPGGVLLNLITHPASLMCELLGTPSDITATTIRRNILPNSVPDLLNVSAAFGDSVGGFTISMGHDNADRVATLRLEGGTVTTDLSRQITTVARHRGPSNIIDKTIGGYRSGAAQAVGMTKMLTAVATKKLQRDPGLRSFVSRFYDAVEYGTAVPVGNANAIACARITDVALGDDQR